MSENRKENGPPEREPADLRAALAEREKQLAVTFDRLKDSTQQFVSLLRLHRDAAREPAAAEALAAMQCRVNVLALVHESFAWDNPLAAVGFACGAAGLVRQTLHDMGIADGRIQADLDIPEVRLDFRTAEPLLMILNELFTNALKHAFADGRRGMVRIRFRETGAGEAELSVSDNGLEMPETVRWAPGEARSLGFRMVAGALQALNGTATLDRDGGNHFTVRFPLAERTGVLEAASN